MNKTVLASIVVGLAVILSAFIAGSAYKFKYNDKKRVSVTGMAEVDFVSDLIVWQGNYSRIALDLKKAYADLKADEGAIKSYLISKGIKDTEIVFSSVNISKIYNTQYDFNGRVTSNNFDGYTLHQNVKVESKNIELVEKISREVTELIQKGIEFNSSAPAYYYTKMSELKIDLLAKASLDAKERSESIAKNAGSNLGDLKFANMGVFQITGQNSNEDYSYGGAFNTSSKNKTASITIRTEYALR